MSEDKKEINNEKSNSSMRVIKLVIGALGIYASFLYYGTLQEDVFLFKSQDGSKFTQVFFLQVLEALSNVIIGGIALLIVGGTSNLPQLEFGLSGASQVCAKSFTSLAMVKGVSFPVVTLAKSGKMVPVMVGSLILGGANYSVRQYISVGAIIAGTCIVSMGKSKSNSTESSIMGLACVILSLICDGITGGLQSRLKAETAKREVIVKPYDFMFWTNLYMTVTALIIAMFLGEFSLGLDFCRNNPIILEKILKFSICSAIGQSFIFFTISEFDSLVCTTITTTRKVFSVLLSIFINGHPMSKQGWVGLSLSSLGILSELGNGGHNKTKKVEKKRP
jgi:UDP-galactose transporter B1